jgi:polygalacturonase
MFASPGPVPFSAPRRIGAAIAAAAVIASAAFTASAQEAGVFDVTRHGAVPDGKALNTAAIQAAIDACGAAGGGIVLFPPGAYLTGTIYLKDNVRLHLEHGATLLGSTDLKDYPVTRCEFPSRSDAYTSRALIWAEGKRNLAITGFGAIDGQGSHFRDNRATEEEMRAQTEAYRREGRHVPEPHYFNRPYVIRFISCRDIRIEDITLRNSPMWMQQYLDCDFVTVRGIKVFNHGAGNNDMIDIDCCRNVIISDCIGDSDDDALTLKSTGARPTEHVVITNCILASHCNAIKAGTESAGGFKDITIANCVIRRSAVQPNLAGLSHGLAGIALEIVDGGSLERVAISNIVVEGTTAPLFLRLGDRARPAKPSDPRPPVGTFRNVTISNVVTTGPTATGCAIAGIPGHPIRDVTLSDIRIVFPGGGTLEQANATPPEVEDRYPESTMFGPALPAYGFYCRHVDGLTLRNVQVAYEQPDRRPALVCDDVRNLRVEGLDAAADPGAPAEILLKDVAGAFITGTQAAKDAVFLKLAGSCERIALVGNDFSAASKPFDAGEASSAIAESGNIGSDVR